MNFGSEISKETQDKENESVIKSKERKLDEETDAITKLEALHSVVTTNCSHIKLHHNIGYVQYAAAISVDAEGGTLYTSDWSAFQAAEGKVRKEFQGNVVDLSAFRLIFLVFTLSNENNFIQDHPSTILMLSQACSILSVVV